MIKVVTAGKFEESEVLRLPVSLKKDVGIGQLLALWNDRSRSSGDVKALALARAAELHSKAKALEAMRRSLERLAASCHGDERAECPILDDLEAGDL